MDKKRKRSRSPRRKEDKDASGQGSDVKKATDHRPNNFYNNRYHLNAYIENHFNIRKLDDFWKFYLKYEAAQQRSQSNTGVSNARNLFNVDFIRSENSMFDKVPLYTRHGDKLTVTSESFGFLLKAIKTYQDFQNKSRFAQLKALRNVQNNLPITKFKEEIIQTINENNVILIAGDTGCGKSTQVPQYIMQAGYKRVGCTQPRRIACITLAKRVAYETLTTYTNTVGFQIRFEKMKNKNTNLIFLTEGILLRQANDVDTLGSYDVIILDEVHERHLNMDFLIGIMKCFLKNKNVKLILMSATINVNLFQQYFESENVKTIHVPGRLYPIDIIYKPIVKDLYDKKSSRFDCQPYLNIIELIDNKCKPNEKGDVLIFLHGASEINTLAGVISEYNEIHKKWVVLQLHSALSLEEQDKVFHVADDGIRKCIISTNIAETSVTIDGVRYVIDSGKVNRMIYDSGVNRLFETDISQDSAKQRAGRAGRTGPGICYRLYSEEQFEKFEVFTPAEIHFVPLENLLLNMVTLGLSEIERFPFIEKPSNDSIRTSLERLTFLEALKQNEDGMCLTTLGSAMSRLPVELTISKMLIVSTIFSTVNAVLVLASLLSVQNPIVESRYFETSEHRKHYDSNHGEPITLLNIYKGWLQVKTSSYDRKKAENSRSWSRRLGVEEQRLYEATKLSEQFRDILVEANFIPKMVRGSLNSAERAVRHGELKQLKHIRAELKNKSKDFKRKRLKKESINPDEEQGNDLRDVEFRITNDYTKLQHLLNESKTESYKDLMLLKLILAWALYPQIAVEDEFNSSKTVNDKLFHTKNKNYVFLRPTSYFNANPEILQLKDEDIELPPNGFFSKYVLSKNHQILIFQKLLETKKTFLVNTFRMPALQTLLLFGNKIATNRTLTKFVVEDFLCVQCPFLWEGKVLLMTAIKLRNKLNHMLEMKLNDREAVNSSEERYNLIQELTDFMQTRCRYNVKRLLPADIKLIYTSEEVMDAPKRNPFNENYEVSVNSLGGYNVSENVIYDCLVPESYDVEAENILISTPFCCPTCNKTFVGLEFVDMFLHERDCKKQENINSDTSEVDTVKPNSKKYHCDKCNKDLMLTPIDYLKHKKQCTVITIKTE